MARRAGLSRERVIDAALARVDEVGLEELTLAAVARDLGVRTPSLYKHVDGLDDVRARVVARCLDELAARFEQAALGRSEDDAMRAVADAYRAFAHEHPHRVQATVASTVDQPEAAREAGERALRVFLAVFRGYDLSGDELVHVARAFRAAIHGFVHLELSGGFRLQAGVDRSYEVLNAILQHGLAATSARGEP